MNKEKQIIETTEQASTYKTRFFIISLLLPICSAASVAISYYLNYAQEGKTLIVALAYVLCFDFISLFYIDFYKSRILSDLHSIILYIVGVSAGFYIAFISSDDTMALVIFCFTVLISGICDLTLGMMELVGVSAFIALFLPSCIEHIVPYIILALAAGVLSFCLAKGFSLFYSIAVMTVFDVVVFIIYADFIVQNALILFNLIIVFSAAVLLTAVYFFKRSAGVCSIEDTAIPSIIEAKEAKATRDKKDSKDKIELKEAKAKEKELRDKRLKHDKEMIDRLKAEKAKEKQLREDQAEAFKQKEKSYLENQRRLEKEREEYAAATTEIRALKKEIQELQSSNSSLQDNFNDFMSKSTYSVRELSSFSFPYIIKLKEETPKTYRHCKDIAKYASEAAEIIGCDSGLAFAIGMYHEAPKLLGDKYQSILTDEYRIPGTIIRSIELVRSKSKSKDNTLPMSREAGIVFLCDDILNMVGYLKSQNKGDVSLERIVTNNFKVRKEQNLLRQSGFSNEEVQLLKLYFTDLEGIL